MDRLWDNDPENDWYDYVDRARKLSSSTGVAAILFGIVELVAIFFALFFQRGVWLTSLLILVGVGFSLLFLYTMYRMEKKVRKFTISFMKYIQKSALVPLVLVASLPYFFAVFITILPPGPEYLIIAIMLAYPVAVLVLSILNRISRYGFRHAYPLKNEDVERKLRDTAAGLHMDYIHPMVTNGTEFRIANAYCSGIFRHRIWITDFLLENLGNDEIVAILSHEYAHAKYQHAQKIVIPVFIAYLIFAILAVYSLIFHVLILYSLFYLFGVAFLPYILYLPKLRLELRADRVASSIYGVETTISVMKKIYRLNLVLPERGSLSHPSLNTRIKKLRKIGS